MAKYTASSPWSKTNFNKIGYLDLLQIRPVPKSTGDYEYTIEPQYNHRPDLLAYDLYGTPKLWWVFAQRNMDILKDPVYDLEPGLTIFLPNDTALKKVLGM